MGTLTELGLATWFKPEVIEAVRALPDTWQLAAEDSYCPLTFNVAFGVPDELDWEHPVVAQPDVIFIAGDNGNSMFYFKFVRAK